MQEILDKLFRADRIAVVGASPDPARYGGAILQYMSRYGHSGTVYPVNPRHSDVFGWRCYSSLDEIGTEVDVVVALVGMSSVVSVVEAAARVGGAVAIVPGGFPDPRVSGSLVAELKKIRDQSGMRIIGPNCVGGFSPHNNTIVGISSALKHSMPPKGVVGLVSQTGGMLGGILSRASEYGVGFSHALSTGDEIDVNLTDVVDYYVNDPATRVVCAVAERIPDIRRFGAVARRAHQRGKSVVVLRLGKSDVGASAVMSHSGRMATPNLLTSAMLQECGVLDVASIEELLVAASVLGSYPDGAPAGRGMAMVSRSGGACSYMADRAAELGVPLADIGDAAESALVQLLGAKNLTNPIDLGATATGGGSAPGMVASALEILAADDGVGVRVFADSVLLPMEEISRRTAAAAASTRSKPVIAGWFAGDVADPAVEILHAAGVPCFRNSEDVLKGVRLLQRRGCPLPEPAPGTAIDGRTREAIGRELEGRDGAWTEFEALNVLRHAGLSVVESSVCGSQEEAVAAAAGIGYPVALKLSSADVAHKFERGGVALDLRDDDAVRAAYRKVESLPDFSGEVIVQKMLAGSAELALGGRMVPDMGAFVIVSAGGLDIESKKDFSIHTAPVSPEVALGMVRDLAVWERTSLGRTEIARQQSLMAEALSRFSMLVAALVGSVSSIDVNPLILAPSGPVAVDGLIQL